MWTPASRDNAPNDCELNISDGVHCNGFYRLTRKRKEKDLIANSYWFYVWYAVTAFESSRSEVCSPELTAGTEWIICIIKKKKHFKDYLRLIIVAKLSSRYCLQCFVIWSSLLDRDLSNLFV